MSKSFPFYHQPDQMDCGATCLRMIAKYYEKNYSLETLRQKTSISREGVSLLGISEAAEQIGFRTMGVRVSFEKLCEAPLPCIVHWKQEHFVVVYDIKIKGKGTSPQPPPKEGEKDSGNKDGDSTAYTRNDGKEERDYVQPSSHSKNSIPYSSFLEYYFILSLKHYFFYMITF